LPVIFKAETAALGLVVGAAALFVAEPGAVLVAGILEADTVVPNPELATVESVMIETEVVELTETTEEADPEPEAEADFVWEVVLLALVTDVTVVAEVGPIAKSPEVAITSFMFETPTALRV